MTSFLVELAVVVLSVGLLMARVMAADLARARLSGREVLSWVEAAGLADRRLGASSGRCREREGRSSCRPGAGPVEGG